MPNAQYLYYPWWQRGLATKISQVDNPNISSSNTWAGDIERTKLPVGVYVNNNTNATAQKDVYLTGPGDVIGINTKAIIRHEPSEGLYMFEDSYLPFIEFSDIDFPWRYTPAIANNYLQLRPWLALIVLKDGEYTLSAPSGDGLPPYLQLIAAVSDVFHPHDQHWAWAHVQANNPADNTPAALAADIETNPACALSRILCPRRLASNTPYTAFLIPAFETGRLAGLGQSIVSIASFQPSWNLPSSGGSGSIGSGSTSNSMPYYFSWRFGTSVLGDFETLARKLVPRVMDASLGGIEMDISNTGSGFNSLFQASTNPAAPAAIPAQYSTVMLEGSLRPPTFTPVSPQNIAAASNSSNPLAPYTLELKNLLNLSIDNQTTQPSGNDDPVVLPPMYGQWHANINKLDSSLNPPAWFEELNLDVRHRAAAGLGSSVVRNNKQKFMESAWQQVGEVLNVNNKISKAIMAMEISSRIYTKHFIGDANVPVNQGGPGNDEMVSRTLKIGLQGLKNVQLAPISGFTDRLTANQATMHTPMTQASVNGGFRKISRSRSLQVKKIGGNITQTLIGKVASGAASVSTPNAIYNPYLNQSTSNFVSTVLYNVSNITQNNSTTTAQQLTSASYLSNSYDYSHGYTDFQTKIQNYTTSQPYTPPINISAINYIGQIQDSLDPAHAIPQRVLEQIDLEYNGITQSSGFKPFKPIMAYPVMDDSTYEYLIQISSEYLLPNLSQYPYNTVALLDTNNSFIESYLAGMNHEFAKELLWQEYPTDQRGSYFRRFWDIKDTPSPSGASPDFHYDINMMHKWTNSLGSNNGDTRHHNAQYLVLFIRGDLLKKYPNALIYAQKATIISPTPASGLPKHGLVDPGSNPDPADTTKFRFPLFQARLQPDIVLVGFDLDTTAAKGNYQNSDPGWFFVFRERPGQTRFGMNETPIPSASQWDSVINWQEMVYGNNIAAKTARFDLFSSNTVVNSIVSYSSQNTTTTKWDVHSNAAAIASILYRDPVLIAIHARDMILP